MRSKRKDQVKKAVSIMLSAVMSLSVWLNAMPMTVRAEPDQSTCPQSADGIHRWGNIEEYENGWNDTQSSLKFYPKTIDDYEYQFTKGRTVCVECGLVLAEYYTDGHDPTAYSRHPCNEDPNADFYLPVKDFIDRGMYCETQACPHGVKHVLDNM